MVKDSECLLLYVSRKAPDVMLPFQSISRVVGTSDNFDGLARFMLTIARASIRANCLKIAARVRTADPLRTQKQVNDCTMAGGDR
jgi:hypothetical protein